MCPENLSLLWKGCLLLPFFSVQRWDKAKTDYGQKVNYMFSLQDSTLNAPQQTLICIHSISIMGDGLAKTISIIMLLQCVHWLIAVKSLDALGSNYLLYQGGMPLLPFFLWLLPYLNDLRKVQPAITFVQCKTDVLCPIRFLWDYI